MTYTMKQIAINAIRECERRAAQCAKAKAKHDNKSGFEHASSRLYWSMEKAKAIYRVEKISYRYGLEKSIHGTFN